MTSVDIKHQLIIMIIVHRVSQSPGSCPPGVKVDGGRPGLSVLMSLTVSQCGRHHGKVGNIVEPCFGIGHSLSLICQPTSEADMKLYIMIIIITVHAAARAAQDG